MEISQSRIEQAIVEEAVEKFISDEDLYIRVKQGIEDRIDQLFQKSAETQINAAINEAIQQGFEREYRKVDPFGHPVGDKTTIKAELERMIGGYWNTRVDKNGKPTESHYNAISRAEWMMTQLVAADFSGEMKQHIVNLGGALKDKLRAELHTTVNKLLSETFNVNSYEDQRLKEPGRAMIAEKQRPLE